MTVVVTIGPEIYETNTFSMKVFKLSYKCILSSGVIIHVTF